MFAHELAPEGYKYCRLEQHVLSSSCLCHLEFGVPQQLNEVATRAGNGTQATDSS